METFEELLTGGHPNSLGNTMQVVEIILENNERFDELYQCYFSQDEVVRLRVSNAMKRICKVKKELLLPYLDRFLEEIAQIQQASTQWTLAQLFQELEADFSEKQKIQATKTLQKNLENSQDWIVLNHTMQTLSDWSKANEALKNWLHPHLNQLSKDSRKSVAKRAQKLLNV